MSSVTLNLTDTEWMDLIDGERPNGLAACCANISDLRDRIISAARCGGEIHAFEIERFRWALGAVVDGHDVDEIAALVKVREQLGMVERPPHTPQGPERFR